MVVPDMGRIVKYSALEVAACIVRSAAHRKIDIDHLKLQKLLYYTQGWHLALNDSPLFPEQIQAWVHGPVVPQVFKALREHGWNRIPESALGVPCSEDLEGFVSEVLDAYGPLSGRELERLSHSEQPWKNARGVLAPHEASVKPITHEAMKNYFRMLRDDSIS